MKNNSNIVKRIIVSIVILLCLFCGIYILNKPVSGINEKSTDLPAIGSSPIYVEMADGDTLSRNMTFAEDRHVTGLELLLVHTSGGTDASISLEVRDSYDDMIYVGEESIEGFTVGDWTHVNCDFYLQAGEEYTFEFTPNGCTPYFMQVEGYGTDISLGFELASNRELTYGEIFYYSIPILTLICILIIALILFGSDRLVAGLKKLELREFLGKFWNELFLILLFVTIGLDIYYKAYVAGVYITADSAGYLREAVNMVAGNGFSYDGLAGYNSWFANWPIIYPAMIALVMLISGANAYLASKIVAIICVGIIELILYIAFKKDAWLYALALTNVGVLTIAYTSWSEMPFMVFMLLFALILGKIVSNKETKTSDYVLLCLVGSATFLTRYFGIFVWVLAGLYWLLILLNWWKSKDKLLLKKLMGLAGSAFVSGVIYVLYLLMNKIKNGNPTGVSRGTWWDDYKTLTDDLVKSLVTEIFNVFSLEIPKSLGEMPEYLQVWFVIIVSVLVGLLIHRCLKNAGDILNRYMSTECVLILMAMIYYGMFIVIRYRSSMDTFYFRFFAPATFVLTIGLIGMVLKTFDLKSFRTYFAAFVGIILLMSFVNLCGQTDLTHKHDYYDITTNSWDMAYAEIPERSVVIWSNMDYRSSYYRADLVEGELFTDDTLESLAARYYGSDNLCMLATDADVILYDGSYDKELLSLLESALNNAPTEATYINISLR